MEPTPPDPVRLALYLAHQPLARRVAGRYARYVPWLADCLESAALEALWLGTVDCADVTTFPRLVALRCRWACSHRLQAERRRNREAFARVRPVAGDDGEFDPLDGIAAVTPPVGAALEARDELARVPADVLALAEMRAAGMTLAEIGAGLGVTGEAVRQRLVGAGRRVG